MDGQMDTESEVDVADVAMEEVRRWPLRLEAWPPMDPEDLMERIAGQLGYTPAVPATAAPTTPTTSVVSAQWPSLDDETVDAQRRRTAYKQERRAREIEAGIRRPNRPVHGSAAHRASTSTARFPPVRSFDSRASITASSSTSMPKAPQRTVPKPTAARRAPSSGFPSRARIVRPRSEPTEDLPEFGTAGMERLARNNQQAQFAAATLYGNSMTGVLHEAFADAIKNDLRRYSSVTENSFLVEYFRERDAKGHIQYPTEAMETFTYDEVLENALLEFNLEWWLPVSRTTMDWT